MRKYIKQNLILVVWELLFVYSYIILPIEYAIYTNFVFYTGILIYLIIKKEVSFRAWKEATVSGKSFWKNVMLTVLFMAVAFGFTICLEMIFPEWDAGSINLKAPGVIGLILFAASTIILPPITEELFFRKRLIQFENTQILVLTTLFSMFLYALEHTLTPWGIILTMIWAIPTSISYIKTKNIYVTMTAHLITNFVVNGTDTVFMAIKMLQT